MKNSTIYLSLVSVTLLAGCATAAPSSVMLDAVGPEVHSHTRVAAQGTLMVFSGVNVHQNSDPTNDYRQYSDYEIWSQDGGKRIQLVSNHRLPFTDDEPTPVKLLPGRYVIKAMANSYNSVTVPVLIVADRMTTLHLDGGVKVDKTHSSPDNVYLPNGEIVGSRAPEKS
jgi:hypothetical protein